MNRMVRYGMAVLILVCTFSGVGHAQDSSMADIFRGGFYGGLAGALVGTATLAFVEDRGDHLDNIAIGAGIGVIAGTAYGIYSVTQPLAMIEGTGTAWRFSIPQLVRTVSYGPSVRGDAQYRLTLLKIHF